MSNAYLVPFFDSHIVTRVYIKGQPAPIEAHDTSHTIMIGEIEFLSSS